MARKAPVVSLVAAHLVLAVLVLVVFLMPDERAVPSIVPLVVSIAVIEAVYLVQLAKAKLKGRSTAASGIMVFVWSVFVLWEVFTTKLNALSVIIFPSPERVFEVFAVQYDTMVFNALYSMELLVVGFLGGIFLGAALGVCVGWFAPVRKYVHPVAKVLAPIPPMVISPYVVLIMPSFRSASMVLVGITTFMFVFLSTIEEVVSIDQEILDSARMLNLGSATMIKDILAPYVLPSVMGGLKLYLIMGFMMLIYSETLGAPYGLGHWISVNHTLSNYTNLIAGFIEIGVLVVAVNKLAEIVQSKVVRWR